MPVDLLDPLAHPVVGTLLLALGALALLAEVREPGPSAAGVAGFVAFGGFFVARLVDDPSGWPGAVLFVAGSAATGWLLRRDRRRAAGLALLPAVAGVVWVMAVPDPRPAVLGMTAAVLVSALLLVLLAARLLWWRLPASRRPAHPSLALMGPAGGTSPLAAEGAEGWAGRAGRAATPLRPDGEGLFDGSRLPVTAAGEWLEEGTAIRVVGAEGLRAVVEPVREAAPGP